MPHRKHLLLIDRRTGTWHIGRRAFDHIRSQYSAYLTRPRLDWTMTGVGTTLNVFPSSWKAAVAAAVELLRRDEYDVELRSFHTRKHARKSKSRLFALQGQSSRLRDHVLLPSPIPGTIRRVTVNARGSHAGVSESQPMPPSSQTLSFTNAVLGTTSSSSWANQFFNAEGVSVPAPPAPVPSATPSYEEAVQGLAAWARRADEERAERARELRAAQLRASNARSPARRRQEIQEAVEALQRISGSETR